MTKIDFYIIPGHGAQQRHLFACRLVEKAYKFNYKVYIHSSDNTQAEQLDQLLWSFRSNSFIPHQLQSGNESDPVIIGYYGNCPINHPGLMVNLSNDVPDFFSRFERIAEIVVQDTQITESTRRNYRFYQDRGYPLDSHNLR